MSCLILLFPQERPKFPGLTVQERVTKFLGLHIRAHNKNLNEEKKEKYMGNLSSFVDSCNLAGALNQGELDDEGYTAKMDRFEKLRQAPWEGFDMGSPCASPLKK